MTKTDVHKKAMIEALTKSMGIVTTAVKIAGVNRGQHYKWMQDDPEYKASVEEIAELPIDFAESQLHKKISEGDTTSIIFFLKTKGKKRGYIERQEFVHEIPQPPAIEVITTGVPFSDRDGE